MCLESSLRQPPFKLLYFYNRNTVIMPLENSDFSAWNMIDGSGLYCFIFQTLIGIFTGTLRPHALFILSLAHCESTRQHPESKGWWGIDEGIQCSLEEVALLNVAKIWTSEQYVAVSRTSVSEWIWGFNWPTFCLWMPEAGLSENHWT